MIFWMDLILDIQMTHDMVIIVMAHIFLHHLMVTMYFQETGKHFIKTILMVILR